MKMNTLLFAIIILLIGILIGRYSFRDIEIEYIKGETRIDTVRIPFPYNVEVPGEIRYKYVYKDYDSTRIDTVKSKDFTVEDWNLKRSYNPIIFDNEYGKLTLDASIQYNKLQSLKYTYEPLQKVIPAKEKIFQPFVSASYSTLNYISVGGGIFYHDLGLELRYVTDFNKKGVDIGLKYKF